MTCYFLNIGIDLILDIQRLNRNIERGDGNKAARIASQLASHGVSLVAISPTHAQDEEEFTYVSSNRILWISNSFL